VPGSIDPLEKDRADEQLYAALLKGKVKSRQREKKVCLFVCLLLLFDHFFIYCCCGRVVSFIELVVANNVLLASHVVLLPLIQVTYLHFVLKMVLSLIQLFLFHDRC
jgi:hypothetical protein